MRANAPVCTWTLKHHPTSPTNRQSKTTQTFTPKLQVLKHPWLHKYFSAFLHELNARNSHGGPFDGLVLRTERSHSWGDNRGSVSIDILYRWWYRSIYPVLTSSLNPAEFVSLSNLENKIGHSWQCVTFTGHFHLFGYQKKWHVLGATWGSRNYSTFIYCQDVFANEGLIF